MAQEEEEEEEEEEYFGECRDGIKVKIMKTS